MLRRPPRSTRTDTLFPYTTLLRSVALFKKMARRADIVLENFAPGTMDRLGVGWDVLHEINPRLIYASGSGFGLSGPYRDYPAMDLTVQAMAGLLSVTGFPDRPPVKCGPALCDFSGGTHLFAATVRSDESRVGQECVSTCRSWWLP